MGGGHSIILLQLPFNYQHPTISINPTTTIQLPPTTFLNNVKQPSNHPFPPPTTIQQQFNYLQQPSMITILAKCLELGAGDLSERHKLNKL